MNGTDPLTRDGEPQRLAPAAVSTGTRGLLSAADIWSTTPPIEAALAPAVENVTTDQVLPQSDLAAGIEFHATDEAPIAQRHVAEVRSPAGRETWPPQRLSLGLQGGGTFAAFTWGVLDRLLEQPNCRIDTISGASAGAVNAVLLACGFVEGGREGARALLAQFWIRMTSEASFRSLMLVGGFSPAGSSVAFGPALRSGQFDPFDLDPLRQALARDIDFSLLHDPVCPKLMIAATRVRDGRQQIFRNADITADVLLASTCPPLVHCAVEIEGEACWDGGFGANPPLVSLVRESEAADVLVVRVTPTRDSYVPITMAAIDRRLDQIMANSTLDAEIAALQWATGLALQPALRISSIAAEDEIEGLAQRSAVDLGPDFIALLHRSGRRAADRWLRQAGDRVVPPAILTQRKEVDVISLQPVFAEPAVL